MLIERLDLRTNSNIGAASLEELNSTDSRSYEEESEGDSHRLNSEDDSETVSSSASRNIDPSRSINEDDEDEGFDELSIDITDENSGGESDVNSVGTRQRTNKFKDHKIKGEATKGPDNITTPPSLQAQKPLHAGQLPSFLSFNQAQKPPSEPLYPFQSFNQAQQPPSEPLWSFQPFHQAQKPPPERRYSFVPLQQAQKTAHAEQLYAKVLG